MDIYDIGAYTYKIYIHKYIHHNNSLPSVYIRSYPQTGTQCIGCGWSAYVV